MSLVIYYTILNTVVNENVHTQVSQLAFARHFSIN